MTGKRRMPPTSRISEFPEAAAEEARWWERHILEALHGLPPDAPQGTKPRPEFDPRRHSLAQREQAKAAERTAAGHQLSASGIKQRRQRYQREGLVALADGRSVGQADAAGPLMTATSVSATACGSATASPTPTGKSASAGSPTRYEPRDTTGIRWPATAAAEFTTPARMRRWSNGLSGISPPTSSSPSTEARGSTTRSSLAKRSRHRASPMKPTRNHGGVRSTPTTAAKPEYSRVVRWPRWGVTR
ncbi:hypothetical protein RKD26_005774 [Streptomyces calvus]